MTLFTMATGFTEGGHHHSLPIISTEDGEIATSLMAQVALLTHNAIGTLSVDTT
jgi:hypothetical protein